MAAQQNFRTAFNGFNREDVVHYIEYLNSKHAAEISQLNSELEYLRTQQTAATEAAEAAPEEDTAALLAEQSARIRELFDSCSEKDALLESLMAETDALKAAAEAKDAEIASLREQLAAAQQKPAVSPEAELEAYRRAERVERRAKERAELVYHKVNGTLADATVKVDDAANLISGLTEQAIQQLTALQNAVTDSKAALKDAASTMYALRPEAEE
jgi:predicted RNase H-like nuclease (RuvC/YqgF family)